MPLKIKISLAFLSVGLAAGGLWFWSGSGEVSSRRRESIAELKPMDLGFAAAEKNPQAGKIEAKKIGILFGGDLMLDRYLRQVALKKGYDYLFEKVDPLLGGNELNVVNLEGPITENPSVSLASAYGARENYIFTFDPAVADVLSKHQISLVSLGNNHILNFKEDGARQTEQYLAQAGVNYFGSPLSASGYLIQDIQGLKIAFVNYNQFAYRGKAKALEDIQKAKTGSDLVILYAHWGKEYETEPLDNVRNLAHEFIDAGADLIIGSHPHVVQGKEVYKDKKIYFSLGNFIFDQYFKPETQEGLAVKVTVDPETKSLTYEEILLKLENNGQTSLK